MSHTPDPRQARPLTRREMFAGLFAPLRRAVQAGAEATRPSPAGPAPAAPAAPPDLIAVIAGRDCLAYQEILCSSCIEKCPVPGALVSDAGLPRVVPSLCTGCSLCHQACPAPDNAIHMVPRPPGLPKGAPAPSPENPDIERRSTRRNR